MDISNPYTFEITKNCKIYLTTEYNPSGGIQWPYYEGLYGKTLLQQNFDLEIPLGISVVSLETDYKYGKPICRINVRNKDTGVCWFDNKYIDSAQYPNVGVTPGKTYHLTIGAPTEINPDNGSFRMNYSDEINSYIVSVKDYMED